MRKEGIGSRTRKGWELTKSSWQVLKLDKELTGLPLLSFIFTAVALIPVGIAALFASGFSLDMIKAGSTYDASFNLSGWEQLVFGLVAYFILTFVANFFGAAAIYGATERFRGGDPTIKSSLAGAKRKFRPLLLFSLMMSTIGFALQLLEDRLPFAGKIAVWLAGAAWNIANLFAIPVIVLSEGDVHPFDATRTSVGIIKKAWGESLVVNVAISGIAGLAFLAYLLTNIIIGGSLIAVASNTAVVLGPFLFVPLIVLSILGLVALMLTFSVLGSIAKAALYHYATTGEAPKHFNRELLEASLTPKKARKIFG